MISPSKHESEHVLENANVWFAERRPRTVLGGSRVLSARWRLLADDRVFLPAPFAPGLNLIPANEKQNGNHSTQIA